MRKPATFGDTAPVTLRQRRAPQPTRGQGAIWEGQRATLDEAIEYTRLSLCEYIPRYPHVVLSYSGGKDSTTLLTLFDFFLRERLIPEPLSVRALMSDTRLELLPLMVSARQLLRQIHIPAQIVEPLLRTDDCSYTERFFVYMLGVGVPPPNSATMRWCTRKLKADPMHRAKAMLQAEHGDRLLNLTGVRRGESANRDNVIATSCSRDGGECGQGWFHHDRAGGQALAPIDRWRICHVEDWLTVWAPSHGYDTSLLCAVYGFGVEESQAAAAGLRTGCMSCPLVEDDAALAYTASRPEWAYLAPIARLGAFYAALRLPMMRLRKNGERLKDGSLSTNHNRMGPLTMEARAHGLDTVLGIQSEVNAAARAQGRPEIALIDADEEAYIRELWARNVWPEGWTGAEQRADTLAAYVVADGIDQPTLGDAFGGA